MPFAGDDPVVACYAGHGRWWLAGSDESWNEHVWPMDVGERLEPPSDWS